MDLFAWANLEMEVLECTKCGLSSSRKNAVFGMGATKPGILFIGEAPGSTDDESGLPFQGDSGQLLDKILKACNFSRDEHLYLINLLKCKIPEGKKPEPSEINACMPFLIQQIEMLQPKIIVLLGEKTFRHIINPEAEFSTVRGEWITWNGIQLIPTWHPEKLIKQPELKKDVWNDFKKIYLKYQDIVDKDHQSQTIELS